MAREAYRTLYGDLAKLKSRAFLDDPAGGTSEDTALWEALAAASDWVDRFTLRHFYPRVQTLEFDGKGSKLLAVPDLISVTSIKVDETINLTFEVTWETSDYWLLPYNGEPTQHWGTPYTTVMARAGGDQPSGFPDGERNVEVVGVWGYRQFEEASGTLINNGGGYDAVVTALTVDDGTALAIGQTIYIGTEQLLITNIATNALTVVRGMNGTTAASMLDDATVNILRIPAAVERATLIQASRVWVRAPAFEPHFVGGDVDTDVRLLLDSYIHRAAVV